MFHNFAFAPKKTSKAYNKFAFVSKASFPLPCKARGLALLVAQQLTSKL